MGDREVWIIGELLGWRILTWYLSMYGRLSLHNGSQADLLHTGGDGNRLPYLYTPLTSVTPSHKGAVIYGWHCWIAGHSESRWWPLSCWNNIADKRLRDIV